MSGGYLKIILSYKDLKEMIVANSTTAIEC